nr:putative reverse transcriptase domain-containing protein [Tanacetum cinerariifolium]
MSADSAVTYSSIHSEARSWSIPSEDPYEEATQQLFEQAPHSSEYVPRDHLSVFVPEFEHPEDLVPAEDEAPASLLPPGFLSPRIRPLSPRALGAEMNAIASSLYHSLHPSGTPPLLPIPLSTPSTGRRAGIPEANTPPRNRPLLATPRPGCEVRESSVATARRPGPTMAHGVDCSYVENKLRDTERRMMVALELVNLRVSYQVDVCTRESLEFCTRHHDAQKDRTAVRAEIEVLRSERLAYELIMARTRKGQTPPPTNPNNPNNMTPEAVQTMIDQALLRNSGGKDESHSSHAENPWNMHTARPCYYADFMKCHPLNFKGTEGAVGLTRWIEKMESVFNISRCAVENQVKFATYTLLDATLTWWNSQIRTLGHDAYTMTWSVLKKKMTDKYCPLGEVKKLEIKLLNLKKLCIYVKRKSDSKRRADDISRNNQQPFKKQNVVKAYNLGSAEKKTYEGNAPKSIGNTNATNNQGGNGPNPRGNERNGNAAGNPDSNVITGTFLLNNRYAFIFFDIGADRSFVSTAFSSLINIIPTPLDNHYDVELADGKIVGINTIIRGCTLNFLNHPFTIDIMLVELGSFDTIIGMDWLRRHHAMIVCDEKLVRVPFGNETLVFRGSESYIGRESRLTVISCSKVQEYRAKGCHVFLAQISATKEDDKPEGKQVKDVPVVQDFPEVFPEDLPGLPPARPVEFQIDLIPGAAPVARAPYCLAPSEMKELSEQLQELYDK